MVVNAEEWTWAKKGVRHDFHREFLGRILQDSDGGSLAAPWQEPFIPAAMGTLFWGQPLQDELFNGLREDVDELTIHAGLCIAGFSGQK